MARSYAGDVQFRVVSDGGTVYGPYPTLGTARGVRTQMTNDWGNRTFRIEKGIVTWESVE